MAQTMRLAIQGLLLLSLLVLCHSKSEYPKWCEGALKRIADCRENGYEYQVVDDCPFKPMGKDTSCKNKNCGRTCQKSCQKVEKNVVKFCGYKCDIQEEEKKEEAAAPKGLKPLFIITPTYTRPTQMAELTILAQSLANVENVQWIVVEQYRRSKRVTEFMSKVSIPHFHLTSGGKVRSGNLCNGMRNIALEFMRQYQKNYQGGVVHFANTDRVYSASVWEKMRKVEHVGIWPVIRSREQFKCDPELVFEPYRVKAKYPVNTGSVGFSSTALLNTSYTFSQHVQDTTGISDLIDVMVDSADDIEVISCDEHFVWYIPFQKS